MRKFSVKKGFACHSEMVAFLEDNAFLLSFFAVLSLFGSMANCDPRRVCTRTVPLPFISQSIPFQNNSHLTFCFFQIVVAVAVCCWWWLSLLFQFLVIVIESIVLLFFLLSVKNCFSLCLCFPHKNSECLHAENETKKR
eukprot:m.133415 g.133415  ORF g.133415 m.133415 type:complete len:139 (-) comp13100_c0_seq1:28-444(-)